MKKAIAGFSDFTIPKELRTHIFAKIYGKQDPRNDLFDTDEIL